MELFAVASDQCFQGRMAEDGNFYAAEAGYSNSKFFVSNKD